MDYLNLYITKEEDSIIHSITFLKL